MKQGLRNFRLPSFSSTILILCLVITLAGTSVVSAQNKDTGAALILQTEELKLSSVEVAADMLIETPFSITPISTTDIPIATPAETSVPAQSFPASEADVNALAVTTLYVSPTGTGSDCTIVAPCPSISFAMDLAEDGDTIKVSEGPTYTGTGQFALTIAKDITLSGGWNATFTLQNGTSTINTYSWSGQKGILVNSGVTATVDYFVIQNNGTQIPYSPNNGGGVVNNGTLTLTGSTIRNFILMGYSGGGVYNSGIMVLNNTTVSGNTVSIDTGGGGGIWNDGTLTLNNSIVSNNKANNGMGGGIWNSTLGNLILSNSIVSDNETGYGGGGILNSGILSIYNSTISNNLGLRASSSGGGIFNTATLTLDNSTISNNTAGEGGGVFNNGGNETINNSLIIGNHGEGGGIRSSGSTILNNSTVANNTSSYTAGGIFNGGIFTANNSTVSNNTAKCQAGGIFNLDTLTLNNSTISANMVECYGGGILNDPYGVVTMQNTILAGNITTSIVPDCKGTLNSAGYNLIGNNSGCTFTATTGDLVGTNTSPIDPRLEPLQNNGGSNFTHALSGDSPARNAGNPAAPGSGGNACLATDQRGITRPQGSFCDIGAYEGFTAVKSIKRLDPNPTLASAVNFNVTFTDRVTGVDTSAPFADFSLTTTDGTANASITSVSGSEDAYTVTIHTGLGVGKIRLDIKDDDSIKDILNVPLGEVGVGNGDFTKGEVYTIDKIHTTNSIGANDGWMLESSEVSNIASTKNVNGTLRVGDDARNRQYRLILHFNFINPPNNAIIHKVTLKIKRAGIAGANPFTTHGDLVADMAKGLFGLSKLENADFQTKGVPRPNVGIFTPIDVEPGWYQLPLHPSTFQYIGTNRIIQFRLRFIKDDNNDKKSDFISFFSGDTTVVTDAPKLTIEYTMP